MDNIVLIGPYRIGHGLDKAQQVAINNSTNVALLAIRMLGISDTDLVSRMSQYQEDMREENMVKGEKLERQGWESYLNQ
ncbi:hypothetical protein Bca4012_081808 [Brassica carinata]